MCGRKSRLLLSLSAVLLLSFSASSWAEGEITEETIRAWAQGKSQEELTNKLVWFGTIYNRLMALSKEQEKDSTATISGLKKELQAATTSNEKSLKDFETTLKMQAARMARINRDKNAWRLASLVFLGGATGYAVDRNIDGFNGLIWGLVAGGATGILWALFDTPP